MEQDACTNKYQYCLLHIEVYISTHIIYNNMISQNRTYSCRNGISDDM